MFVLHNVGLKNYFAVISFGLLEQINEGVAQVKGIEQTIHNFNKKFNLRTFDTSLRLNSDFKFEEYKTYIMINMTYRLLIILGILIRIIVLLFG